MGSAMTGFSRALIYKNMRLKLVDVEKHKDIGYIVIAEDDERNDYGDLGPKKMYR